MRYKVKITAIGFRIYDAEIDKLRDEVWSQSLKAERACADLNDQGRITDGNYADRLVVPLP